MAAESKGSIEIGRAANETGMLPFQTALYRNNKLDDMYGTAVLTLDREMFYSFLLSVTQVFINGRYAFIPLNEVGAKCQVNPQAVYSVTYRLRLDFYDLPGICQPTHNTNKIKITQEAGDLIRVSRLEGLSTACLSFYKKCFYLLLSHSVGTECDNF